jgi:hypothetical protein
VLIVGCSSLSVAPSAAQLSLEVAGIPAAIDFTGFDGTGFSPEPAAGQLDSDVLSVGGFSEGDLPFATSAASGDFARGITTGGVSSGGLYAFDLGEGDMALGVQPTASDYSPGFLTLCIENGTAMPLDRIQVTYDVVVFNDQDRSSSWNLSIASDALGPYEPVPAADFASAEIADEEPVYTLTRRSVDLATVTLLPGERLFLHWTSDDAGGGGSRDEIGLDNVSITGRSSIPDPNLLFGDGFESGDLSAWSEWAQ